MDHFQAKFTVPVLCGVFGIIGSLAIGGAQFIPEKK